MIRATVLVGGHPFDGDSFAAMWQALRVDGIAATTVAWPDAAAMFDEGGLSSTDVLVLYDMPGVGLRRDGPPIATPPPEAVAAGWVRLLNAGVPVVALHHAIASWPAWEEFATIIGGRFHYAPADLAGVAYPDSGYRHEVHQRLFVADPGHPVCAGLPAAFELVDETYLCPIFDGVVTALITTDAPRTADEHYSAALAVAGRRNARDGWDHPPGSRLAAWTHRVRQSTIVYIQPGDGPAAFANLYYRRLLANAVTWAATTGPT